ncbi:MAG TPA: hypothetical protein VE010_03925, partial [Thermoanaerobaculia bacterium]|nr:hypothetical protein [Thermoanaerobaculia bacterium]
MKKLAFALAALCSTVLVCTEKDTGDSELWVRSIEPRLSTAREWRPCRKLNARPRQVVTTAQCGNTPPPAEASRQKACDVLIRNREEALRLLVTQPQCIDTVISSLETISPTDLAAAYYRRAQVMDRASDLLRALHAAQNAVKMNDNLPVSLFNQAIAQEALGLRSDAIESWTRFLEVERGSEWADEARARRGALLAAPVMLPSRSARASVIATEPLEDAQALRKLEAALTAAKSETDSQARLSALHRLEAAARAQGYGALVARVQATLAFYLSTDNRPEEALEAYDNALATYTAIGDEAGRVKVYVRRTGLLRLLGGNELSWRDALRAIRLAPHAVDSNDQHLAYGEPAATAAALGYPEIALKYQTAAVQMFERDLLTAKGAAVAAVNHDLGIALRERAAISLQLAQYESARKDLDRAIAMTDAVSEQNRLILQARIHEVQGQASLPVYPNRAVRAFTDALALAAETDDFRSVRANLFVQRADAHARAGRTAQAQADLRQALAALRPEQSAVLQTRVRGKRESLWHPYFSRFEETYQRLIRLSIEQGDYELALAYAEESRSIDPLDLLSLSGPLPPQIKALGRTAETMDIRAMRAQLPPNTFVIEYALFDDRTYAWVMSRDRLEVVTLRARRRDVERWARELQHAAFTGDALTFEDRLQAPYYELVAEPLAAVERL